MVNFEKLCAWARIVIKNIMKNQSIQDVEKKKKKGN